MSEPSPNPNPKAKAKTQAKVKVNAYLRRGQVPHTWCPGCGNGNVVRGLIQAVQALGLDKDEVVVVGGIGCSGRTPFLLDFNTMHTTHGRALAFATGVKLVRPELKVIVTMGDGDSVGIGGNHFIHAARRNIDLTAIVFNNGIYGMTGGQAAPTTPLEKRSATAPEGGYEPPFDLVKLSLAAGASYVARTTTYDFQDLPRYLERAIAHRGFSVVEVITQCPTYFGRLNGMREPYEMLNYLKDQTELLAEVEAFVKGVTVSPEQAEMLKAEELEGKLVLGEFVCEGRSEYTERSLPAGAPAGTGTGGSINKDAP